MSDDLTAKLVPAKVTTSASNSSIPVSALVLRGATLRVLMALIRDDIAAYVGDAECSDPIIAFEIDGQSFTLAIREAHA